MKGHMGRDTNSDFWVPHSSLHDIIIRFSLSLGELCLLALPNLVLNFLLVCLGIIMLSGLLYGFDGLDVVPHRVQDVRLPDVRLDCRIWIVSQPNVESKSLETRSPNLGSTLIAASASFNASGRATNLVYAFARLLYPLGSFGSLLILSVYALTAPAKSPFLNKEFPSSLASADFSGSMYASFSASALLRSVSRSLLRMSGVRCSVRDLLKYLTAEAKSPVLT